ncbi:NAD(+)/NADH kinase [Actomonas aquatica]|uniref:NAD kinase n=1 Tax=Actomonas aquatica TaxID=2866162 RepID=A0ABZ1CAU1_9BACT|nr:NAD(+)/NADH kinase [Opitutus sp. WL0086]WRQ88814.1 NAD(+)/NADH kinase [Opitutus sp. WL0086]
MTPLRHLAFVINAQKEGAADIAHDLMAIATEAGATVKTTSDYPVADDFLEDCDSCCVIGGDGTLLGVTRAAARSNVPIIGVNRGSLGFLTTFSAEQAREYFADIIAGNYTISERALLDCSSAPGQHDLALNDVLIKDERHSRLVELSLFADDEFVTTYSCDGLIFSSPTGSTAYNLSAGGPLIHPTAETIVLTPICPHTLSNRSIIFRQDVQLRVIPRHSEACLLVAVDGQRNISICEGNPVHITVSDKKLRLINHSTYNHFAVVRQKLGWSGGAIKGC